MKISVALLAASAAVASAQANIDPLILSGTIVPAGTKTYTVGLRSSETASARCGGSLITPTHVLTAGHCGGIAKFVSIGSHFISGTADGERIAVKKETVHPRYNEGTKNPGRDDTITYDYSIIELASPSSFPPVKLYSADSETFVGVNATVMGWGRTTQGGVSSRELLRVDVPVVSDANCKAAKIRGASKGITETMFCAGGATNRDSCQGDSGGPLILEEQDGDLLVGVVSWGEGCGLTNKPGVYSKVSFAKDWILSLAPGTTFV